MKIFSTLYVWVIHLSQTPKARVWLFWVSFSESSFFIIPPDVMLAPMTLANTKKWRELATITTLSSVAGGVLGYAIGYFFIESVFPWIQYSGYQAHYDRAYEWFKEFGVLAVLIAGFSPIPYKMSTIASGVLGLSLPLFIIASLIGRGSRFFLVAFLIKQYGEKLMDKIKNHMDKIGWGVTLLVVVYVILKTVA